VKKKEENGSTIPDRA
jgi:hypothetical protein